MKKVGIITIYDNDNYGNRLQNYATQEILHKNNIEGITIKNNSLSNHKSNNIIKNILGTIRPYLALVKNYIKKGLKTRKRRRCFKKFNKNIKFSKTYFNFLKKQRYDYFIVGSDQVWNPNFARLSDLDLITFTENKNKIAFAASFGISKLPEKYEEKTRNALKEFKAISVREDAGKEIVEKLTELKDVEVVLDPTMLLNAEEWESVAKKPDQLKNNKFILSYFLGKLSDERRAEINRIAKENDCEVINILEPSSPFYQTGPAEFLYLEKNAFLICTDSFHSCVFSILFNKPFIIFDREGNKTEMNSRIETLINKFNLKNRKYNKKITEENLQHDYSEAYEILQKEREKSMRFLSKALDIEGEKW